MLFGPPATRHLRSTFFPEVAAGGFTRVDGSVDFYTRVNALVDDTSVVVDFGAGRGEWLEDDVVFRRRLRNLRGRVARVIGVDVDPVVRENAACDETRVCDAAGRTDLADGSVDVVLADHTFEHVDDAAALATELDRVLRPGGWVCARTPNRWGYIGLGARVVPNVAHTGLLRSLQPDRQARDVFPVRYRLNTRAALLRHFPPNRWEHCVYTVTAEPAYFGTSRTAWRMFRALSALVPAPLGAKYMIFLRKRP